MEDDTININGIDCITTGKLNARLKYFTVKAEDLKSMGIEPATTLKAAKCFAVSDIPKIKQALINAIEAAL